MPWNYDVSGSKPLTRVLKRSPNDVGVVMSDPPGRVSKGKGTRSAARSHSTNRKPFKGYRFHHYDNRGRGGARRYWYRTPRGSMVHFPKRLTNAQTAGW